MPTPSALSRTVYFPSNRVAGDTPPAYSVMRRPRERPPGLLQGVLARDHFDQFVLRGPKSSTFDAVKVFVESGGADHRVVVHPPADRTRKGAVRIEVRCVRIDTAPRPHGCCSPR